MKGISAYSLAPLLVSIIAVAVSTFFLTAPWPDYQAPIWNSILQDALPVYISAVAVVGIAAVTHIMLSPKKKYNLTANLLYVAAGVAPALVAAFGTAFF